jgi:hypothetical protein
MLRLFGIQMDDFTIWAIAPCWLFPVPVTNNNSSYTVTLNVLKITLNLVILYRSCGLGSQQAESDFHVSKTESWLIFHRIYLLKFLFYYIFSFSFQLSSCPILRPGWNRRCSGQHQHWKSSLLHCHQNSGLASNDRHFSQGGVLFPCGFTGGDLPWGKWIVEFWIFR